MQAAIYRRPYLDLYIVEEGNSLGKCSITVILDRYHSQAMLFGSCESY